MNTFSYQRQNINFHDAINKNKKKLWQYVNTITIIETIKMNIRHYWSIKD